MALTLFFSYGLFWLVVIMYVFGLLGTLVHNNMMKKLMAMNIMQTAIIVFYLLLGNKPNALTPILVNNITNLATYVNPLPQALMLTAIVVNLSTTGIALTFLILMQRKWETLEEDEILKRMCDE